MSFLSELLAGPEPRAERVSLSLMTTYACQLRCRYCQVRPGRRRASKAAADAAVGFLLRSAAPRLELKFFGGEPLLAFDLVKYAAGEALRRLPPGRDLQLCVITNGLALDQEKLAFFRGLPSAQLALSFDGDERAHALRAAASGAARHAEAAAALRRLAASGLNYFVNVVVTPETAPALPANLAYIAGLGAKRVQVCYDGADYWSPPATALLAGTLAGLRRRPPGGLELLNAQGDAEPVALRNDLVVDTDGRAYLDGAIFMERRWPLARKHFYVGKAAELGRPEEVCGGRREHLRRWLRVCATAGQKKIFVSTLKAGAALRLVFGQARPRTR